MYKFHTLFVSLLFLLLTSCGGSSSDSTTQVVEPPPLAPPTATTTDTTGVITGFGSVFVNGVEYETDAAAVSTDDNDAASESDLQVGMVITLSGEVNDDGTTGSATKIHYEEQVKGPLESIDLAASTMVVFGQNIIFDELTNLDNLILETLNLGDFLEISGFFDDEGNLYASRIEKEDNVETLKVQGTVSLLDTDAQTFQLADLIIDYSSAVFDDFTADDLANDLAVRVKGDTSALIDGTFTINKIQLAKTEAEHQSGDARHIEGIISAFESSENFVVNGVNIITNADTNYEHGTVDSLALHVRVKIKGVFDANDNLLAQEVRIHQRSQLKIAGLVQAIDLEQNTVTVLDVVFQVNEQTKMKDKSDDGVRFFDLADLMVDDYVEVKGFIGDDALNIATKLERENTNADSETELKGKVSNIVDFTFEVLDITVNTNENTIFEGVHGDNVNQAQFFEQLNDGTLVEVKGQSVEGVFTATKVEIKERDDDDDGANRTELRGIIEEITDNGLVISGHTVNVSSDTEFEIDDENVSAEQFWLLAKVGDQAKVKGIVDGAGVITAKSIELEIAHEDKVAKVEITGEGTLIEGVLTVLNHQVEFDDSVSFKNLEGSLSFEEFLEQAPTWAFFHVTGILRENVVFASKIKQKEQNDDSNNIELTAFVEAVLDDAITIAGHKAVFTEATRFFLRDESISKEDFFARVDSNNRVELEGLLSTEEQSDGTSAEIIISASVSLKSNN